MGGGWWLNGTDMACNYAWWKETGEGAGAVRRGEGEDPGKDDPCLCIESSGVAAAVDNARQQHQRPAEQHSQTNTHLHRDKKFNHDLIIWGFIITPVPCKVEKCIVFVEKYLIGEGNKKER